MKTSTKVHIKLFKTIHSGLIDICLPCLCTEQIPSHTSVQHSSTHLPKGWVCVAISVVPAVHLHLGTIFPSKNYCELSGECVTGPAGTQRWGQQADCLVIQRTEGLGSHPNKGINNPVLLIFGVIWK